ncbi:PREDICTED: uncharacterized protein LOC106746829 isoform X1 [Dinoponera quadriceps]|uniref:Uncharacterized protein LOC106746829 isoform X1 n=1 Tax=Dinoponera quadriceps TaxID=609295 RepID=A0A6P3XLR8_DINQU|nr:PREDICTED: uncharacterized protein LOC106746829 isoform X1 [Dinoponera quadriceps]
MKRIWAVIILTIYSYNILLALGAQTCFQFTWRGSSSNLGNSCNKTDNEKNEETCEETCPKNIPCVKPFHNSKSLPSSTRRLLATSPVNQLLICEFSGTIKPNTTRIWERRNEKPYYNYFCNLNSDNVCIKYTYVYNEAEVNVSYFCGKVIEDQTSAVTSGCYTQHTEGYTIEACACQPANNAMPCNATVKNTYSMLITIGAIAVTLFLYKIFNIP